MRRTGAATARRGIGLISAITLIGASTTPAFARGPDGWSGYRHYGYPGYYRHRHHHDRFDAGDAFGIALLIGAVAVIASAASKDRKDRSSPDPRYDSRDRDDRSYDEERDDARGEQADFAGEDEAVNACASAARDEAERRGGYAEILDVERPRASGQGWRVQGSLEHRRNYQDKSGLQKSFTCAFENGRVAQVDVRDYMT